VMEVGEGILMETRKTIKHILTLRSLSTDKIHMTFDFNFPLFETWQLWTLL
jgi:hypothetical protein